MGSDSNYLYRISDMCQVWVVDNYEASAKIYSHVVDSRIIGLSSIHDCKVRHIQTYKVTQTRKRTAKAKSYAH